MLESNSSKIGLTNQQHSELPLLPILALTKVLLPLLSTEIRVCPGQCYTQVLPKERIRFGRLPYEKYLVIPPSPSGLIKRYIHVH